MLGLLMYDDVKLCVCPVSTICLTNNFIVHVDNSKNKMFYIVC